jgi:hypothetical protein
MSRSRGIVVKNGDLAAYAAVSLADPGPGIRLNTERRPPAGYLRHTRLLAAHHIAYRGISGYVSRR